jgi:cytochrome c-type biogenesis protein CcmH/NrfG
MAQKKYDDALESIRRAMTLMPDNPEVKQAYDRLYKYIQDIKSGAVTPPP